jgi:UDP-glucose 4-epimerase
MAVYGHASPPFSEEMLRNPIDPYGVAKSACEQDIEIAGQQHGLDWCIIRPHNVYGAHQNIWDSYRNVLGIWMYKKLNNQPFTIYGDGSQVRAFSYIDDSLPCLWKAGVSPKCSKEIINLGGIIEVSIKEAAETLARVVGGSDIIYLPPRHEVWKAFSTYDKSVELLDFAHKTSLEEGLTKMWEWVILQPIRPRQIWKDYELDDGIYPYWKQDELSKNSKDIKLI